MSDATNKVLPKGRTLKEFQTLEQFENKLYPAEKRLLEACRNGRRLVLADARPTEQTKNDSNTIRAEFLRFMALGGDDQNPVHEAGVLVSGAWFEGVLDLNFSAVPGNLLIERSHFTESPSFRGANIDGSLNLKGSILPGFSANHAVIKDALFLTDGFTSNGTVDLISTQIGHQLICKGGTFNGCGNAALLASRAVIKGHVFLDDGFTARGKIQLLGTHIGGDIYFEGASLENSDGSAFEADAMLVDGTFFFRHLKHSVKGISLDSAHVGGLGDDSNSWGSELKLNGFVYGHIADGPVDAPSRLQWLKKQKEDYLGKEHFRPQPWKQLEKVLREMGHNEEARQIGIEFQKQLYANGRMGQPPTNELTIRNCLHQKFVRTIHWLFGFLAAYGYRPLRLFAIMCVIWLVCGVIYWSAALQGFMAPSNRLIFDYVPPCVGDISKCEKPLKDICKSDWYLCDKLPEDYTTFSPMVYSLDVLLPLVNLQQEQDWAPLIPTPKASWCEELFMNWSLKHWVRLVVWFEILFGWVASLLFVAVVSGLSKRSED